jgi:hypothetical protein
LLILMPSSFACNSPSFFLSFDFFSLHVKGQDPPKYIIWSEIL